MSAFLSAVESVVVPASDLVTVPDTFIATPRISLPSSIWNSPLRISFATVTFSSVRMASRLLIAVCPLLACWLARRADQLPAHRGAVDDGDQHYAADGAADDRLHESTHWLSCLSSGG